MVIRLICRLYDTEQMEYKFMESAHVFWTTVPQNSLMNSSS